MISQIEERFKRAWSHLPAKVTVKEISRKSQLPHWKECGKDEIHVGVIRRKKGDRIIIVRHQISNDLDCRIVAEGFSDEDFFKMGAYPISGDHTCKTCKEFSTRLNVGHICTDCNGK